MYIARPKKTETPEQLTDLMFRKLGQVIESADPPDAKTLRDCTAVLKELTALRKDQAPPTEEEGETLGVILLPQVQEE